MYSRQEKYRKMNQKVSAVIQSQVRVLLLFFLIFYVAVVGCSNTNVAREYASTYYGFVTDSSSGSPNQNSELLQNPTVVDSSDSSGYYRFTTWGLSVTLTCRATGYQAQTKSGRVYRNGDSLRIDFKLVP